jgi:Flp pilus assembly pilin Flp
VIDLMWTKLRHARFIRDCRGQDLVEYALLVALIGIAATAAAPTIEGAIRSAYIVWNTQNQDQWLVPNPGAGGS